MSNKLNIHFDTDFTIVPNQIFKDKRLSLKAKGLWCTIISLNENWSFSIAGLAAISDDKETSIRTAIDQLEEFGYLDWQRIKIDGKFFVQIDVFLPDFFPHGKISTGENPLWENVDNKETTNKESILNKESTNTIGNLEKNDFQQEQLIDDDGYALGDATS